MENNKKTAWKLILLFGVISLLGDVLYEGARSVNGPYLQVLGANAMLVGLIAGVGEFLGYAIRIVSGHFADKTKAYWFFTIGGYSTLMAVPLLSLTGVWQYAAVFIIVERVGKGIRSPAKDTILSQATKQVGTGFGFAIAEFLDQLGAALGPLVFTMLFLYGGAAVKTAADYQEGYSFYWLPFGLLMLTVLAAYCLVRDPEKLELAAIKQKEPDHLTATFWLYCWFSLITTAGFVSFVLIGYHLKVRNLLADAYIPLCYTAVMLIDALAALVIGKMYDRLKVARNNHRAGLLMLLGMPVLTAAIPLLVFTSQLTLIFAGLAIWGIVMGTHETIMKAAIADITSLKKRGTGYGIFHAFYGAALFFGSALVGCLYDYSMPLLVAAVIAIELCSLPVFFKMKKSIEQN